MDNNESETKYAEAVRTLAGDDVVVYLNELIFDLELDDEDAEMVLESVALHASAQASRFREGEISTSHKAEGAA